VTVPNFVGKTKGEISKTCDSLKLKCSYKYGGYNESVPKDTATAQNTKNGSKVMEGTSVVITLSSGKAKIAEIFNKSLISDNKVPIIVRISLTKGAKAGTPIDARTISVAKPNNLGILFAIPLKISIFRVLHLK